VQARPQTVPWVPIKGALKQAREAAGLKQEALAARAEVSVRTVKALESDKPPATMTVRTYDGLSGVLRKPVVPFARWVGGSSDSTDRPQEVSAEIAENREKLPARSTVSLLAERERTLDLHDVKVKTAGGELPLLGLNWFKRIWSRPTKHDGMRFLVAGCVDDHQGLNRSIRKKFEVHDGGKYLVVRWLEADTPYYATVFAFSSDHADALTPIAEARRSVAMIVRVQYAPPAGDWKGFVFFGKDRTSHDFAFICDEILPDAPPIPRPRT
jgi:transcriptional regulator with XRE-family HTH domain